MCSSRNMANKVLNPNDSSIAVKEIGTHLGQGLLSGVGGKFGAAIFDSIFPSGTPSYFTEVYQEIGRIVKDTIEQNTINEINGNINGLKTWVKNVYIPRKNSGVSKEDLFKMIQDDEYDIAVHMVAVLQEPAYREPGLGVFVIGAGMHLTLLQELAFVDPHTENPEDSSYAVSVQKYAKEYADFVDPTYNSIEEKRIDDEVITTVKMKSKQPNPSFGYVPNLYWSSEWKDKFLGKTFKDKTDKSHKTLTWSNGTNYDLEERSDLARLDHIAQVKKDTAEDLHNPKGVADMWRELENQPIPLQIAVLSTTD